MISTKGRYALRVMINIALYSGGEYISLKDIAKREEISLKYLEQVIALLNKASLVQSLRGNSGGYRLSKNPKDITAGDILRAAEGSLSCVSCLSGCNNDCLHKEACSTISFWEGLNSVIDKYVDGITLEDLVNDYKGKIGYYYSI